MALSKGICFSLLLVRCLLLCRLHKIFCSGNLLLPVETSVFNHNTQSSTIHMGCYYILSLHAKHRTRQLQYLYLFCLFPTMSLTSLLYVTFLPPSKSTFNTGNSPGLYFFKINQIFRSYSPFLSSPSLRQQQLQVESWDTKAGFLQQSSVPAIVLAAHTCSTALTSSASECFPSLQGDSSEKLPSYHTHQTPNLSATATVIQTTSQRHQLSANNWIYIPTSPVWSSFPPSLFPFTFCWKNLETLACAMEMFVSFPSLTGQNLVSYKELQGWKENKTVRVGDLALLLPSLSGEPQ